MLKKRIVYMILCALLFISRGALADGYSISDALDLMKENNAALRGKKRETEATAYQLKAAKGLRYPSVSVMASYIHLNEDLELHLNGYRDSVGSLLQINPGMLGSWDFRFQKQDIGIAAANLTWPLYTGGQISSAIEAARVKDLISRLEVVDAENALISLVVDRYYLLKLAQEALQVRLRALSTCKAHLFNAGKLEEQGMIAAVERMQAQSAVSDASREAAAARKDIALAKAALTGAIGRQDLSIDTASSPLFEFSLEKDLEYYREAAKTNCPAIVKAGYMERLAEQEKNIRKARSLPQVALLGSRNLYTENLILERCNYDWVVGIGLTVTLFNGMQDTNRVKQSEAVIRSIALQREQAQKEVQVLAEKYVLEILKQQEQYRALATDRSLATEMLRVRTRSFAEGLSSSTDVADASLNLAAVELSGLRALYEMDRTLARLLELCGQSRDFMRYVNP